MKLTATLATAIAALACAGSLRAHHSASMFDAEAPVWLKGTVVRYSPINPHAMIALEQRDQDGQVQQWAVEGPSLNGLELAGVGADTDFLHVGDVIEVCGFPFKEAAIELIPPERRGRIPSPMAGTSQRPVIHGHVLVMPDGAMRRWGPYGKLENCVRPDDDLQAWETFVNATGHDAWCNSKAQVRVATLPPREVLDEIDRHMTQPCGKSGGTQ